MADGLRRDWQNDTRRKKARAGFTVQEKLAAAAIDGERVRGSGCSTRPGRKGDAESALVRLSAKTTEKGSIRLTRDWWDEISAQARATGQVPMLVVGFDAGARQARQDVACVDLAVAEKLLAVHAAVLDGDLDRARALAEMVR